jgi:hypothetical protein
VSGWITTTFAQILSLWQFWGLNSGLCIARQVPQPLLKSELATWGRPGCVDALCLQHPGEVESRGPGGGPAGTRVEARPPDSLAGRSGEIQVV